MSALKLQPENFYHVYNRAVGFELLFHEECNYRYFWDRIEYYILDIIDLYAFCFMPNHFHLLIRVHELEKLCPILLKEPFPKFKTLEKVEGVQEEVVKKISKRFSNLFSSYTQGFNKAMDRKGSLFMKNFKRKAVNSDQYFIKLVSYIHFNPVCAGLVNKPSEWQYSSFNTIINGDPTILRKKDVLAKFGGLENFLFIHMKPLDPMDF